jgi:lipopolysaccharide transport protein LptA
MAGSEERPKNARTIIESDDGATFENSSNSADFIGHVIVRDPQFDLTCDRLHVVLRPDRKGLQLVVATGNVTVTQQKRNDRGDLVKSVGKCGKATYDPATGDVTLEEWPQIQQGINNQVATQSNTVMVLNAKGRSRTIGSSRTMIIDQGQGDKPATP